AMQRMRIPPPVSLCASGSRHPNDTPSERSAQSSAMSSRFGSIGAAPSGLQDVRYLLREPFGVSVVQPGRVSAAALRVDVKGHGHVSSAVDAEAARDTHDLDR